MRLVLAHKVVSQDETLLSLHSSNIYVLSLVHFSYYSIYQGEIFPNIADILSVILVEFASCGVDEITKLCTKHFGKLSDIIPVLVKVFMQIFAVSSV